MSQPLKTFVCYAREDRDAVDDLRKHLKQAEKNGTLEIWDDGEIHAGQDWDKAIKGRLKTAQLILLFVSVDFINSDYIEKTELQAALQRHRDGEATLVPIIVRRCDWQEHFGIGQFQALPKEARPIKSVDLSIREEMYYEVAQGIKAVAQEMKAKIARDAEQAERLAAEAQAAQNQADASAQAEREKAARAVRQAESRLLQDEAAWDAAEEENDLHAYRTYIEEGFLLHKPEAEQRVKTLQAAALKQKAAERAAQEAAAAKAEAERKKREETERLAAEAQRAKEADRRAKEAAARKKAEEAMAKLDPFHDLMVPIKGGTFDMGDTFGDGGADEKPVHKVTVRDFHLGKHPVTQAQWEKIMGENPSHFKGGDLPVEQVSWDDAQIFIKKLNEMTGKKYRLPTEAEWEYAAREGGKKIRFGNGKDIADPKEMNFDATKDYKQPYSVVGEYRQKTTPVGAFKPNALGLHDMSGNVWEWCQDTWHDTYAGAPDDGSAWEKGGESSRRVVRGGSWYGNPADCRAACRDRFNTDDRYHNCGLRLAR